jgi:hypothetical protein
MIRWFRLALMLVCVLPCVAQQPAPTGVLSTEEIQRLMPPSVFFEGQTATVQIRNSFGVRFSKGGLVLAGLVDTGGYSSAIRDRYQFYLLADTAFEVGGKRLAPGAYGCGFLPDGLLVMDLSGHDLMRISTEKDSGLTRPRPLQMMAGKGSEEARLYLGREFVTIRHAE